MARWCKLTALIVGFSVASVGVQAQDASPPQDAPTQPTQPRWWSWLHRNKSTPDATLTSSSNTTDQGTASPIPVQAGAAPVTPQPVPGTQPFTPPPMPPAEEVIPSGPGLRNGFSDPIPPDIGNGLSCDVPQPDLPPWQPYFIGIDYIHWWVQKQPVPALVTTGSMDDAVPGAFGQPNTKFLIDDVSDGGAHDGFRLTFGYDFDRDGVFGIAASYFWLNTTNAISQASGNGSAGSPVLTRPFYNAVTGQPDADPINLPGVMAGTFIANAQLSLMGADADLRWLVNPGTTYGPRLTLLGGIAFYDLDEKLLINESLNDIPGLGAAGNHYTLGENFTTYNRFFGGQLGAALDYRVGPVVVQFVGKCGLGNVAETLEISGYTNVVEPNGAIATNPKAALYTGPGNVGHFTGNQFAAVPEGQFKIAYEFNPNVRMNFGYDVLWISQVLRPGNQINQDVNVQPVGAPQPVPPLQPSLLPFRQSGLWAQGFSLGLEFNF